MLLQLLAARTRSGRAVSDVEVAYSGPDSAPIWADGAQLRQMIWNLVRNAVQASSPGDSVEDPVEHELGSDRGVVEPRQEERPVAAHPGVANHQVFDRGPLGMSEMERAGHIRRRLDDGEGRERRIRGRAGTVGREDVRGDSTGDLGPHRRVAAIGKRDHVPRCVVRPRAAGAGHHLGGAGIVLSCLEDARVRVDQTGTVKVYSGSSPHGQGEETTFSQIVADGFWRRLGGLVDKELDSSLRHFNRYGINNHEIILLFRKLSGVYLHFVKRLG